MARKKLRRTKSGDGSATAALIASFFQDLFDQDLRLGYPVTRAETAALCSRLSEQAEPTLSWLARRYHVEVPRVLAVLWRYRMAWRFENDWKPFADGATLRDAEAYAEKFETAAVALDALRGFLTLDWRESFAKVVAIMEESSEREMDWNELLRRLGRAEVRRQAAKGTRPTPQGLARLAASEAFEQFEALELLRSPDDAQALHVPQQIEDTIAVLRKAAWICRRREWSAIVDSCGREVFRPGKRRQLVLEKDCATELVQFLRAETGRALLDHVGQLLMATFPETCGARWGSCARNAIDDGKRLKDAVAQMLGAPPPAA